MSTTVKVKDGQSIAGLAATYGLMPETIWDAPENSKLKEQRDSPYTLLDGTDEVFIPDPKVRKEQVPVKLRTAFLRKRVPDILKIRFADRSGKPRKGLSYLFEIDGEVRTGEIDGDGLFQQPVPPAANRAMLTLRNEQEKEEKYDLFLSHLDPATELSGAQQRLMNMGYNCGKEYGGGGPMTERAILAFQHDHGMKETGQADPDTLKRIAQEYGR